MNSARAMLDALMGPQRDVDRKSKKDPSDDWKDASVCKNFLLGFCPYDKAALGGIQKLKLKACTKIHSELIRDRFAQHSDGAKDSELRMEYEDALLDDLNAILKARVEFAVREKERMKSDPRLFTLPRDKQEEVDYLVAQAVKLETRAAEFEKNDYDAKTKSNIKNQEPSHRRLQEVQHAVNLRNDADDYRDKADEIKKAELKKLADRLKPQTCEVCGTGCLEQDEYDAHVKYRVHEGFQLALDKMDELETAKRKRPKDRKDKLASKSRDPIPEDKDEKPRGSRGDERERPAGRRAPVGGLESGEKRSRGSFKEAEEPGRGREARGRRGSLKEGFGNEARGVSRRDDSREPRGRDARRGRRDEGRNYEEPPRGRGDGRGPHGRGKDGYERQGRGRDRDYDDYDDYDRSRSRR
mmetsp:Transcript_6968/g.12316  ORF Transcript_6968/g.12316 Transcript_6968/m.12316 type:complete len:412 (-) Transcript_6968:8-1243(-)